MNAKLLWTISHFLLVIEKQNLQNLYNTIIIIIMKDNKLYMFKIAKRVFHPLIFKL